METKLFELRDRMTFIPIICTACQCSVNNSPQEIFLLRSTGYNAESRSILLTRLAGGNQANSCYYCWNDRTYRTAHKYIEEHWDNLDSGDVIDVEYILGEVSEPKESDCLTASGR